MVRHTDAMYGAPLPIGVADGTRSLVFPDASTAGAWSHSMCLLRSRRCWLAN